MPEKRVAILLLLLTAAQASSQTHVRAVIGHAHDRTSGELLYTEQQQQTWTGDRLRYAVTAYISPAGDTLAVSSTRFDGPAGRPVYRLDDRRDGYVEGIEAEAGCYRVFRQKKDEPVIHDRRLCDDGVVTTVDDLQRVLVDQWRHLAADKRPELRFLVPNRLASYRLRVRKIEELSYGSRPAIRLRVEPANFFIRLIAPHADLVCDLRDRRILEYEGITNLGVVEGSALRHRARVVFEYPDGGEPVALSLPAPEPPVPDRRPESSPTE